MEVPQLNNGAMEPSSIIICPSVLVTLASGFAHSY